MEYEEKVFHSEISRVDYEKENHLYDLLEIEPAKPIPQRANENKNVIWEFTPKNDIRIIQRKVSKLKVKTVSEIRSLFEKDTYSYLNDDLKRQQNYLLRKIRDGFSSEETTKKTASSLLNGDKPISRYSWQMLVNINPEKHNHPKQFVLWNSKCIQVNGSRGGKTKFICNYDLKHHKKKLKNTSNFKKDVSKLKIGLLRNSLNVKFKPGPLVKKKILDDSHHKYQMGGIEIIKLPKPGLEISPAYGIVLEPAISNFVNNMRGETGEISQKLAEFAVSVLGTIKCDVPTQLDKDCCVYFDLNYKCNQNRLIMRRNVVETTAYTNIENDSNTNVSFNNKADVESVTNPNVTFENQTMVEVKKITEEMLNAVEISLQQDLIYSTDEESREVVVDNSTDLNAVKDKTKRRYCELGKLDVTVITLPESSEKDYGKPCGKSFCTLGCICESLDCVFSLKRHCGLLDCMFGCKCEVSKYKGIELLDRDCSEIIPGLLNLDNQLNSNLAKEEQKFHQTVIVSGEKSIFLKSRKRTWKSSKKYAQFYSNMNLKSDENIKRILTIDVKRLNCDNIEPFCMVHNLYKCFCKGKFTESSVNKTEINAPTKTSESLVNKTEISAPKTSHTKLRQEVTVDGNNSDGKRPLRPRPCHENKEKESVRITESNVTVKVSDFDNYNSSARALPYVGRKYTDEYYKSTHTKISEMEKNDNLLRKKMLKLINGGNEDDSVTPDDSNLSSESLNYDEFSNKINKSGEFNYPFANVSGKTSLKTWLETSYKKYKERLGLGIHKNVLDAPKKGKAALQSWDFILSRYRERKNVFFISKRKPFRTFLAVDEKHPFFDSCMNIDDIRFADLHKYPLIIQNLITNATDAENSFCILRGWDHCWELIGSAVKVIESVAENLPAPEDTFEADNFMTQDDSLDNENDACLEQKPSPSHDNSITLQADEACKEIEQVTHNSERSKWFVMTVENDFSEIQFYKKGFYVTYDGIQRSICLARISGKTVRLSSQSRLSKNGSHHFGIYAIPCINECCVFIGPYDIDESLGIEVLKTCLDPRKQRQTRGVWITTNTVDNMKVIEHPLSFMPSGPIPNEAMLTLGSGSNSNVNAVQLLTPNDNDKQDEELQNLHKNSAETGKIVKPIKIRRTNGFYHLSGKRILKKLPIKTTSVLTNKTITVNKNSISKNNSRTLLRKTDDSMSESYEDCTTTMAELKPVAEIAPHVINLEETAPNTSIAYIRPVAEIAPQIKITSVYSERNFQTEPAKSNGSGMLILKPEEINKKILVNTAVSEDFGTDIEKFLETSTICIAPQDEVYVISDGEDDAVTPWKDVWIKCCNVDNFGCVRGRLRDDKMLSFEFPGFKYSEFYTESEAYNKINQVLARKIFIPKNITLQWKVMHTQDVKCKVLTSECLKEKKYLLVRLRHSRVKGKLPRQKKTSQLMTLLRNNKDETDAGTLTTGPVCEIKPAQKNETTELFGNFEQTSMELENQSLLLWNEAITRRDEIFGSLTVPDNLKEGMSQTLQDIMTMNKS